MDYESAVNAVRTSLAADDLNGLTVEEGKLVVADEEGHRWAILLAALLPDPGHTAEECPDRIDRPEYTIPANTFHGQNCYSQKS